MSETRYYRVGPSIWREPWGESARHLAFYLLTCEHRKTEGLYYLPEPYALADLRWPVAKFRKALAELEREGFVQYDREAGVVFLPKALKWQAPQNPNQIKHALTVIATVPETPLLGVLETVARTYCEPFAKALRERFQERLVEPHYSTSSSTTNASSTSERSGLAVVESDQDRLVA